MQSVTVTAATALNDSNPQVGVQFSSDDLINLPENVRSHGSNELLIASSSPGVSGSSPDYGNPNNISLGGGRPDTNPIIVDGMNSTMGVNGTYGLIPTPDSTQELQVFSLLGAVWPVGWRRDHHNDQVWNRELPWQPVRVSLRPEPRGAGLLYRSRNSEAEECLQLLWRISGRTCHCAKALRWTPPQAVLLYRLGRHAAGQGSDVEH